MEQLESARRKMIENQLKARGITDAAVLRAMEQVPRNEFVPAEMVEIAYSDSPLPIGEGQTISQPYIVAAMAQLLATGFLKSGRGPATAPRSWDTSWMRCLPSKETGTWQMPHAKTCAGWESTTFTCVTGTEASAGPNTDRMTPSW